MLQWLLVFGPGGSNAGHAGIGDELAHVLVGMNDDAQIHAVDGGVAIDNVDLALEVFGRDRQVGGLHGVEGTFQPTDNVGFRSDRFLQPFFHVGRHFGTGHAEQIEIRESEMHEDFAGGAHSGCGTPGEFLLGHGLGQCEQLAGYMAPFAVISLPKSFRRRLREQGARTKQ